MEFPVKCIPQKENVITAIKSAISYTYLHIRTDAHIHSGWFKIKVISLSIKPLVRETYFQL